MHPCLTPLLVQNRLRVPLLCVFVPYRCRSSLRKLQPNKQLATPPRVLTNYLSNTAMVQSDKKKIWRLEADKRPAARQKVIATEDIRAGTIIATVKPLCTSLLPAWRGKRCDTCMSTPIPEHRGGLSACSRCKSAWYCDSECKACQ